MYYMWQKPVGKIKQKSFAVVHHQDVSCVNLTTSVGFSLNDFPKLI